MQQSPSIQGKIDSLIQSANSYFFDKNLVEALVEYNRAHDLFDILGNYYRVQKQEIQVRIAVCYDLLGNFKKAETFVLKSLETVPNFPYLVLYKSVLLLVNGNIDKANLELIKYKQISLGKTHLIYETFRLLFYYLQDYDLSVILTEIEEIATKYPLNSLLLLLRATIYLQKFYKLYPELNNINNSIVTNSVNQSVINNQNPNITQSRQSMELEFNFLMNTFRSSAEGNALPSKLNPPKEDDNQTQNKLIKLKFNDSNYLQYKADIEAIMKYEAKENAEFLLREGISIDSITKLFFLIVHEMEDIEPKPLIKYKSFFSGISVFYVILKAIKLFKIRLSRKKLLQKYQKEIKKLSLNINKKDSTELSQSNISQNPDLEGYSISLNINIQSQEQKILQLKKNYEEKIHSLYSSAFLANYFNNTKKKDLLNSEIERESSLNQNNSSHSNSNSNTNTHTKSNSNNCSAGTGNNQEIGNLPKSGNNKDLLSNFFIKQKYYCNSNLSKVLINAINRNQRNKSKDASSSNTATSREKPKVVSGRNPSAMNRTTTQHSKKNIPKAKMGIYSSSIESNQQNHNNNSNNTDKLSSSNQRSNRHNSTLQMKCGDFTTSINTNNVNYRGSYHNSSGEGHSEVQKHNKDKDQNKFKLSDQLKEEIEKEESSTTQIKHNVLPNSNQGSNTKDKSGIHKQMLSSIEDSGRGKTGKK